MNWTYNLNLFRLYDCIDLEVSHTPSNWLVHYCHISQNIILLSMIGNLIINLWYKKGTIEGRLSLANSYPSNLCLSHLKNKIVLITLMPVSSHIWGVLIVVKYWNCGWTTLDVYLLFAIMLGKIKSKLNDQLVTYKLASP